MTIEFDDFMKVDIRAGTITEVDDFPEARKPAWKLTIDFGDLIGRQIMAVVNFPPRQIGPFMSEVLTLGAADESGKIVLLGLDHPVPNGSRMH